MQTPDPTLHDFVLKLLSDAGCREAFDLDPVHALSAAGLPDVTPQDVVDAIPLVMDFASASGDGFSLEGSAWGGLAGGGGGASIGTPFGGGSGAVTMSTEGVHTHGGFGLPDQAGGNWELDAGLDGVSVAGSYESVLGGGELSLGGGTDGFDGGLQLSGLELDSDTIGRGGDLVTGTVAGFVTDGGDSFAGVLTEGAASLSQHLTGGAETAGGLVTDGAGLLGDGLQDPGSLHVPSLPAGVPDLTSGLPAGAPALPAVPSLPDVGTLPLLGGLGGGLPDLPVDLPVDLPQLPVDLPELPVELPGLSGLPAAPQLPSLPGVDAVHDTVAGVTSNVPLVGDLTDGLTDHLPLGH